MRCEEEWNPREAAHCQGWKSTYQLQHYVRRKWWSVSYYTVMWKVDPVLFKRLYSSIQPISSLFSSWKILCCSVHIAGNCCSEYGDCRWPLRLKLFVIVPLPCQEKGCIYTVVQLASFKWLAASTTFISAIWIAEANISCLLASTLWRTVEGSQLCIVLRSLFALPQLLSNGSCCRQCY